jgi:hypothetical protein
LGHYQAARAAAQRACERDDFALLEGALAELVEASVRSGSRGCAVAALRRLEARAQVSGSAWAMGVAACARALLGDDERAEGSYLEAIERLGGTRARVALGRVRLLYGEWLRRRGRRVGASLALPLVRTVLTAWPATSRSFTSFARPRRSNEFRPTERSPFNERSY